MMDVTSSGPQLGFLAEFPDLAERDRFAVMLGVPSPAATAQRILQTLANAPRRSVAPALLTAAQRRARWRRARMMYRVMRGMTGILVRLDTVGRALDHFQELTRRFPDYWYGWLLYGDALLHEGPALGYTIADARVAFEKATVLNADLIPAWEHLALASLVENDSSGTREAIEALDRLNAGPVLTADGYGDRMLQFRFLQAAQRGDSALVARLADSIARDPAPAAVTGSFYDGYGFGFFPEQLMVSRRALIRGVAPQHREFHEEIIPLSFLGRGVQPPTPAWGMMIFESQSYFLSAPWLVFIPGVAILVVALAFNLAGDGLRDALDPTQRGRR